MVRDFVDRSDDSCGLDACWSMFTNRTALDKRFAAARRYETTFRRIDDPESVTSTLVSPQACATAHHKKYQALGPLLKESC